MERYAGRAVALAFSMVIGVTGLTVTGHAADPSVGGARDGQTSEGPAATVLPASADAYVDSAAPDANFGGAPDLETARWQFFAGTRVAFLRFDTTQHVGDYIERAKLRLHASAGSNGYRSLQVYGITGQDWSESGITWANAPRFDGQWLEMVDAVTGTGWYEADVTAYVNEYLAGGGSIAFRIENEGSLLSFSGRAADDHQPELVLFGDESTAADEVPRLGAGEDGSDLWLRYPQLEGAALEHVRDHVRTVVLQPPRGVVGTGEVLQAAAEELQLGFSGLSGREVTLGSHPAADDAVLVGTVDGSARVRALLSRAGMLAEVRNRGDEGFVVTSVSEGGRDLIVVASTGEQGAQYGAFRLLQLAQRGADLRNLEVADSPRVRHRMNNHWANFAADVVGGWSMVERGYSGASIWQLDRPAEDAVDRYVAYARANASVGINGTVLNNVNATDHWIRSENLPHVAAIADALRPYGVRVHLSLRFDSPITLGGLDTADPFDDDVQAWWRDKIDEIYGHIPDFGGFLVKGDSEGQPGPIEYGRTHADGANMLAEALAPHDGIVIWRAFVYGAALPDPDPDRLKQAYQLFKPLDGQFADNVILQTKNGPFDFQPREPVAPLLGGMPQTNTGIELPLMKEYTGQRYHANYLMPEFERIFAFDTHASGEGTEVSDVIDGSAFGYTHTLVAGVANYGMDANWTRHPLDQANWYGFGRQAWNPSATSEDIAAEWVHLTFTGESEARAAMVELLMDTGETYANYVQPLGLPISVGAAHFKNEVNTRSNYNADTATGVGYDRTRATGSAYVDQYVEPAADRFEHVDTTPEELLLTFHHVDYSQLLPESDVTVIQRMYDLTFEGVERATDQLETWRSLEGAIDERRWRQVDHLFQRQVSEAINYRNLTNVHFFNRSRASDERGRDDSFSTPTATVPDQFVGLGDAVRQATSTESGRIYLVPEAWGSIGKWEREARLNLAADELTGTTATVEEPGQEAVLDAPHEAGSYRMYAVDEYGNVSPASQGTVTVVADELFFDVAVDEGTLLGGRSVPAEARIVNGLDRDVEFQVALESPSEWDSDTATGTLASGAATSVVLDVTPPAAVEPRTQETLRFTLVTEESAHSVEVERPVVPGGNHVVLALDAGSHTSPVLDTYTTLAPDDAWDAERGFGWVGGAPEYRDRGAPDVLRRDFTLSRSETVLRLALPPGAHRGFILTGDQSASSANTIVTIDGDVVAQTGRTLPQGEFTWLSFELDGGQQGRTVDLHLRGENSSYWRVAALAVIPG